MADWATGHVGLHFIPPGEPWRNGYVESFNSRIRDECLNINSFWSLAQALISDWKDDYNHCRRHPSVGKTIDRHDHELFGTLSPTDRRAWRRPEAPFLLVAWPLARVVDVRPHESKHVLVVVGRLLLHQNLNVTVMFEDAI